MYTLKEWYSRVNGGVIYIGEDSPANLRLLAVTAVNYTPSKFERCREVLAVKRRLRARDIEAAITASRSYTHYIHSDNVHYKAQDKVNIILL